MRAQHHGRAFGLHSVQQGVQTLHAKHIEAKGRFVQQQERGAVHHGEQQRSPQLVAGAELAHRLVQAGQVQQARKPLGVGGIKGLLPQAAKVARVLPGGEPFIDGAAPLQQQAHAAEQALPHRLALKSNAAGIGLAQAANDLEQGALAGAIGAEQTQPLASGHGQREVAQRLNEFTAALEALGHALQLQQHHCPLNRP